MSDKKGNGAEVDMGDDHLTVTTTKPFISGRFEIPFSDLERDVLELKKLTLSPDFDTALQLGWHKIDMKNKEKVRKHSILITLYRVFQDGNLDPAVDLSLLYKSIDQGKGIRDIINVNKGR